MTNPTLLLRLLFAAAVFIVHTNGTAMNSSIGATVFAGWLGLLSLTTTAQVVEFADPNLEAVVREALGSPSGDITVELMQDLKALDASYREIFSLIGLESAHELRTLNLSFNSLTDVHFPAGISNLISLDLNGNLMTHLALPADLLQLRSLNLAENDLHEFSFLTNATQLARLNLQYNNLTELSLPSGLTNLRSLDVGFNNVTNFDSLEPLTGIIELNLDDNGLRSLSLPRSLADLTVLTISINRLTNFSFLTNFPFLAILDISASLLREIELPDGLSFMSWINLAENRLHHFEAPGGWTSLSTIALGDNMLTNICLAGLTALEILDLPKNQLTDVFLPPELNSLRAVTLSMNPLQRLRLSSSLAEGYLSSTVSSLRTGGVAVDAYPTRVGLRRPHLAGAGDFVLTLEGPPGDYRLLVSDNLEHWEIWQQLRLESAVTIRVDHENTTGAKFFRAERANTNCP